MNAFFEFLKWFIKLSLVAVVGTFALVAAFVLGRKTKKEQKLAQAKEAEEPEWKI